MSVDKLYRLAGLWNLLKSNLYDQYGKIKVCIAMIERDCV